MQYNPDVQQSSQKAFIDTLVRSSGKFRNVVLLAANSATAAGLSNFARAYPERFFNFGNATDTMIGAAAGFTARGKIPFICTYALAATGKSWDQIRNYICAANINVKIIGTHAGLLRAEEGALHQALEDVAIMRALPNMKVICPADAEETKRAVESMIMDYGPTYLRLANQPLPELYDDQHKFVFGKGNIYKHGTDLCIFASGTGLHTALEAANILERDGVSTMVINMASIKPIDSNLIVECARQIPNLVTVEDHNVVGGLGSAVAEVLCARYPAKLLRIGMEGFGESGKVDDLFRKYGMDAGGIAEKVSAWMVAKD
jgi:transketolase